MGKIIHCSHCKSPKTQRKIGKMHLLDYQGQDKALAEGSSLNVELVICDDCGEIQLRKFDKAKFAE